MKFSIRSLLLLTSLVAVLAGIALPFFSMFDDSQFVQRCRDLKGKSIADVLADPGVQARYHSNFDEPPGTLCGIFVEANDGRFVVLSVKRFPELFSEEFVWDEAFFADCEVVSVHVGGQQRSFLESLGIAR